MLMRMPPCFFGIIRRIADPRLEERRLVVGQRRDPGAMREQLPERRALVRRALGKVRDRFGERRLPGEYAPVDGHGAVRAGCA